jgi:hypothetical protein
MAQTLCWRVYGNRQLTGSRLCVRSYHSVSIDSQHHYQQHTGMALMFGSSMKPPDRASAPVRLPASRHTPVHECEKSMVAQRSSAR